MCEVWARLKASGWREAGTVPPVGVQLPNCPATRWPPAYLYFLIAAAKVVPLRNFSRLYCVPSYEYTLTPPGSSKK